MTDKLSSLLDLASKDQKDVGKRRQREIVSNIAIFQYIQLTANRNERLMPRESKKKPTMWRSKRYGDGKKKAQKVPKEYSMPLLVSKLF